MRKRLSIPEGIGVASAGRLSALDWTAEAAVPTLIGFETWPG
jgi:hypothetical protein